MDPWIVSLLVAAIAASGAWLTTLVTFRARARDERQVLIDQLQEERNWQADERRKERLEFTEQLQAEREMARVESNRFWDDKALSRSYVGQLRAHIMERRDPPPPIPPAGYIE